MKSMIVIPVAVMAVLAAAAAVCRTVGIPVHPRELIAAAGVAIVSAELSLTPGFFTRRADQVVVMQAALGGTVLHLFITLVLAGVVVVAKLVTAQKPFAYWLMAAYWASLAALAVGVASMIRAANAQSRLKARG